VFFGFLSILHFLLNQFQFKKAIKTIFN